MPSLLIIAVALRVILWMSRLLLPRRMSSHRMALCMLLQLLCDYAQEQRIGGITAVIVASNQAMVRLHKKLGHEVHDLLYERVAG